MDSAIRLATPDDARAIAALHVEGWRAAYRDLLPDDILDRLSVDERATGWRERLARPASRDERVFIIAGPVDGAAAAAGDGLLGFAAVGPTRDRDHGGGRVGEIYAIHLAAAIWRQGAGSRLLERAVDDLRAHGYGDVTLWVLDGNERA